MPGVKFSIVIACSHGAESLGRTLDAVRNLEYPHGIEAIIIDDSRHEGRKDIVRAAAQRGLAIRYLELPGISKAAAWNAGLRESSGQFVAFLDDDCIPPPQWLNAYESRFAGWVVGVAGGPDRSPRDASVFERCVGYVLTSFVGTLGMRRGAGRMVKYYPRPWNMAARKESLVLAGGFDEDLPEAPETSMIARMEKIGYRASYEPDAWVWHYRETDFLRFLARDFRLGMERGRGSPQPGIGTVYNAATFAVLVLLTLLIAASPHSVGFHLLQVSAGAYALLLAFSALHSVVAARTPAAVFIVPLLLTAHHASHIAGYLVGRFPKRREAR